jgi:hypothetical protein
VVVVRVAQVEAMGLRVVVLPPLVIQLAVALVEKEFILMVNQVEIVALVLRSTLGVMLMVISLEEVVELEHQ